MIGDDVADAAVEQLFKSRNKVRTAIEMLARMTSENRSDPVNGERELHRDLRSDLFGSFDDRDELGKVVVASIETIQKRMNPIARLDDIH